MRIMFRKNYDQIFKKVQKELNNQFLTITKYSKCNMISSKDTQNVIKKSRHIEEIKTGTEKRIKKKN
jgi:hypothetical protein